MGHAAVLYLLLGICVIPSHLASTGKKDTQGRNERCLQETTVEGCATILLSWSYSNESSKCEKGFVCHECPNRFDTHEECAATCPNLSKQATRPKLIRKQPRRNCKFWLMRGGSCQDLWFEFKKNKLGVMRRLLYYSGCRQDKNRLFEYDFYRKKCHEVKNRPSEKTQQKGGKPGARSRGRRPTSSGEANTKTNAYKVADEGARE